MYAGSAKRLRKKDIFCVKSLIIMTLATKFKQSNSTSTFIIHPQTETIAKQMGGALLCLHRKLPSAVYPKYINKKRKRELCSRGKRANIATHLRNANQKDMIS